MQKSTISLLALLAISAILLVGVLVALSIVFFPVAIPVAALTFLGAVAGAIGLGGIGLLGSAIVAGVLTVGTLLGLGAIATVVTTAVRKISGTRPPVEVEQREEAPEVRKEEKEEKTMELYDPSSAKNPHEAFASAFRHEGSILYRDDSYRSIGVDSNSSVVAKSIAALIGSSIHFGGITDLFSNIGGAKDVYDRAYARKVDYNSAGSPSDIAREVASKIVKSCRGEDILSYAPIVAIGAAVRAIEAAGYKIGGDIPPDIIDAATNSAATAIIEAREKHEYEMSPAGIAEGLKVKEVKEAGVEKGPEEESPTAPLKEAPQPPEVAPTVLLEEAPSPPMERHVSAFFSPPKQNMEPDVVAQYKELRAEQAEGLEEVEKVEKTPEENFDSIRKGKESYNVSSGIATIQDENSDLYQITNAVAGFLAFSITNKAKSNGQYNEVINDINYTTAKKDTGDTALRSDLVHVNKMANDAAKDYIKNHEIIDKNGKVDVSKVIGATIGILEGTIQKGHKLHLGIVKPELVVAAASGIAEAIVDKRPELVEAEANRSGSPTI